MIFFHMDFNQSMVQTAVEKSGKRIPVQELKIVIEGHIQEKNFFIF
jgi:hypothetical protein